MKAQITIIMNTTLIAALSTITALALTLNQVNGLAGSLDNLQSQLNDGNAYRTQLEDYVTSHDMVVSFDITGTKLTLDPKVVWNTEELEAVVASHMQACKSGSSSVSFCAKWSLHQGSMPLEFPVVADC